MSSILDALEKLEARRAAGAAPRPPRRRRRAVVPVVAGAVLAFVAGIAITMAWVRPSAAPAPVVEAAAVVAPAARPAATSPVPPEPAAVKDPPPAEPGSARARAPERPWGEVVTPAPSTRFTAEPIPADDGPGSSVRRAGADVARSRGNRAATPPQRVALATEPPADRPAPRVRPEGAPPVRVSLLLYSNVPARRSVALTIGDAGLVTLHEGESAGGVSVVQILPDEVGLAWQGQEFTLPARD